MKLYLGIDVGSVSINLVALDSQGKVVTTLYKRTQGQPIQKIQSGLKELIDQLSGEKEVLGVGVTGSGRHLANVIVGADSVKNEITAHAVAASRLIPGVQTVLEIGGQDSKIILIRDGIVHDFAMNTVCAAGTGSFLDQQAARLGIPIENFGELALQSRNSVRIAGRCSVFAESDMIHKQQMGHKLEDIIRGLCEALVKNYLNNVGKGKEILAPVVFQGGVAANAGIREAFERILGLEIYVPEHYGVMGALGAALLAKRQVAKIGRTRFKGLGLIDNHYLASSFECKGCANACEVIKINQEKETIACWGDRCGKWSEKQPAAVNV